MAYFIIIRGPLGVGKTTIAKKLAKILDAKYISIDAVLEKSGLDKVSGKEKYISLRNFITVNKKSLPKMKNILKRSKIIVLDGNFYYKKQIQHLIRKLLRYKIYIFTLKATLPTCIKRDGQRKKPYGKDAVQAVYSAVSRFDYGIKVKTDNKTTMQVVREIYHHLPKDIG